MVITESSKVHETSRYTNMGARRKIIGGWRNKVKKYVMHKACSVSIAKRIINVCNFLKFINIHRNQNNNKMIIQTKTKVTIFKIVFSKYTNHNIYA